MKKILSVVLAAGLLLGLCACGSSSQSDGKTYKIGVIQLVQHDALDKANEGFVAALKERGYEDGKNLEIDQQNAAGDQSNCQSIADQFVSDKKDLIFAIATPAAQAVANKTTKTPILISAVTDPKDAGLVKSNKKPGTNVSGTSDLTPVEDQIKLVKQIVPKAKTVGVLYASNESNSLFQAKLAKKACKAEGLKYVEATVSSSNEIQQVTENLADKVDVIYTPTDNTIAAGMQTVSQAATAKKVPIICGESNMVEQGGLITYGIDYYKLGQKTGNMAADVLEGKAKVKDMPIQYLGEEDLAVTINSDVAEQLGIEIPQELQDQAK